jgi:peptide chain release factor 1
LVFDVAELDKRSGSITFRVSGAAAEKTFRNEAGGHRIQHIPKHDKKGRTHTSTITVAVLQEPSKVKFKLDWADLEISTCRAGGKGGQHVNKTESAVQVKHKPSGLMVRCESERSQAQNKESAVALLTSRLWESQQKALAAQRSNDRKNQVGSGQRGDKRRSYYFQRDEVVDHELNKTWRLKSWLRGDWE